MFNKQRRIICSVSCLWRLGGTRTYQPTVAANPYVRLPKSATHNHIGLERHPHLPFAEPQQLWQRGPHLVPISACLHHAPPPAHRGIPPRGTGGFSKAIGANPGQKICGEPQLMEVSMGKSLNKARVSSHVWIREHVFCLYQLPLSRFYLHGHGTPAHCLANIYMTTDVVCMTFSNGKWLEGEPFLTSSREWDEWGQIKLRRCPKIPRLECDPWNDGWLVVSTPLKDISQLGLLFPIYGKQKNVPNHQPDQQWMHVSFQPWMRRSTSLR